MSSPLLMSLILFTAADAPPVSGPPLAGTAAHDHTQIVVWRRGVGPPHKDVRAAAVTVPLDALPTLERTLNDVAGKPFTLRGVSLEALVARGPFDAASDTVALRFHNGTRVQIKRTDLARFDIFLARSWRMSEQGEWSDSFEPVPLGTPNWSAARALEFRGNRVFLKNADPPGGVGTFNPWGFVDSLEDVELLNAEAWQRSFDIGDKPLEKQGLQVWQNRCQTCHGARGAGARLGWDFVDPLPVPTWRDANSLFDHVRAHKLNSAERGLLMPPQPDVTKEEIVAVHAWMKALSAHKKLNQYQP